jgi:hypothetical protein
MQNEFLNCVLLKKSGYIYTINNLKTARKKFPKDDNGLKLDRIPQPVQENSARNKLIHFPKNILMLHYS